jgi:hypothetical protein
MEVMLHESLRPKRSPHVAVSRKLRAVVLLKMRQRFTPLKLKLDSTFGLGTGLRGFFAQAG